MIIRRFLFFAFNCIIYRFNYLIILKESNFIKKNQYQTIFQNLEIQRERLYKIVDFSINNIDYYRRIAQERQIKISKKTIFEDVKKFPILTKDIIRKNWNSLHVDLKKIKYEINTSGGTTGEPIKIIQDQKYQLKSYASTLAFDEYGKYKPGNSLILLWGNENDIINQNQGFLIPFINKFIKNIHFQNSFKMSKFTIYKYISEINSIKPKVILAYIQSIYELAKNIYKKKIVIHPIESIITSAGDLTPELREYIEQAFNCKMYNRYGSREVSLIAMSCERSDKLHINMYHQFVEILDDQNNRLIENGMGNIVITNLLNFTMPLIRYKIGDAGSLNFENCECGRGLIRLNKVYGRIIDFFINSKKELVYGDYFTHLFYYKENIKQFQVIQKAVDLVEIKIVTLDRKELSQSYIEELINKIRIVMGNRCKIHFKYVDFINPSISGKFRYTISELWN